MSDTPRSSVVADGDMLARDVRGQVAPSDDVADSEAPYAKHHAPPAADTGAGTTPAAEVPAGASGPTVGAPTAPSRAVSLKEIHRRGAAKVRTPNGGALDRAANGLRRSHALGYDSVLQQSMKAMMAFEDGERRRRQALGAVFSPGGLAGALGPASAFGSLSPTVASASLQAALATVKPPAYLAGLTKLLAASQATYFRSPFADAIKQTAGLALASSLSTRIADLLGPALSPTFAASYPSGVSTHFSGRIATAIAEMTKALDAQRALGSNPGSLSAALGHLPDADPAWTSSLMDFAVGVAFQDLEEFQDLDDTAADDLRMAVRQEVGTTLDAARTTLDATQSASPETTLAALAFAIWARVLELVPTLSPEQKQSLLTLIVTSLVAVSVAVGTVWWQRGDHPETISTLAEIRDEVREWRREQARDHAAEPPGATGPRWLAVTSRVLRDNPDSDAKRIGSVPKGGVVMERERVGRWIYVAAEDQGVTIEGWVYLRDMRPVAQ